MEFHNYSDIRGQLETGDQVFFLGGRGLVSWLIRRGNRIAGIRHPVAKNIVHVGTVIRDFDNDQVLLSESTMLSGLKDISTGKISEGLRTVYLSDRVIEAGGTVYIRRLHKPLKQWQVEKISELRHQHKGKRYERNYIDLFRAAFDWFGPENKGDASFLFCSEWCAMQDIETQLLTDNIAADEYIPAEMALNNINRQPMIEVRA